MNDNKWTITNLKMPSPFIDATVNAFTSEIFRVHLFTDAEAKLKYIESYVKFSHIKYTAPI